MKQTAPALAFAAILGLPTVASAELVTELYENGESIYFATQTYEITDDSPWGGLHVSGVVESTSLVLYAYLDYGPVRYGLIDQHAEGEVLGADEVIGPLFFSDVWYLGRFWPVYDEFDAIIGYSDGFYEYVEGETRFVSIAQEFGDDDYYGRYAGYIQYVFEGGELRLVGWAYETEPGTDIVVADLRVPTPAGLGVIGLGGLVATRRRR